ncbi:MAG TPA: patatin-like phospholipase family protein [Flavobacteriales bacterium]|jgi:NTE family protein|nr:patatin-like phospholipase family protein [Flavobacteriales bacterium]
MAAPALVISGGGSKGAFAVGVTNFIRERFPEKEHTILLGTSTGALIAPLVAVGQLALVERIYTSVRTEDIITKGNVVSRLLGSTSLFDARPLARLIDNTWTPALFQQLMASQKRVYVTTVCMQSGEVVYWGNHDAPALNGFTVYKVRDRDEWIRAVMASACQPVFMPPIELRSSDGTPRQYFDGGLREYIAVEMAIALDATEIHAVALSPAQEAPENKRYTSAFGILEKTIDRFSDDVGLNDLRVPLLINSALRRIGDAKRKLKEKGVSQAVINACFKAAPDDPFQDKEEIPIHLIRPEAHLGGGPGGLTFDPTEMRGMLRKGYERAQAYFAAPPPTDPFIV